MKRLTRAEKKQAKKREKKHMRQALDQELREHRSSFIVFYTLRLLVLVVLVRQLFLRTYEGAFFCILTILLLYVPSWLQVKLRIELPPPLEITILCFIFAAEILGEVNAFYVKVPNWDTMLHTLNGFLAAAVGFSLVVLVRQLFLHNYEGAFFCILTILLLYVPSWIQVKLHIELPPALEITILCFIFAAEILGEVNAFYVNVPNWDTMLHTLNGFLAAAVGFSMVLLLNDNERLTFDLSPFFLALVAFCFSMTIGVLWEFFEFGMDYFFHTGMQKDTVVNALYAVALDPTRTNKVVAVKGIQDVVINGESLGLGGYLDIGIIDTMKDLFVNFIGAVVFSITGFFYARSKGEKRTPAQNFVPSKKTEETDYLKQAREKSRELSGQETDPKEE